MHQASYALSVVALLFLTPACNKGEASTSPDEASTAPGSDAGASALVPNLEAEPGDTTLCPFSGKSFVVKAEHPKVEYEGESYWVCSEKAAESVRADPGKYLDGFEG